MTGGPGAFTPATRFAIRNRPRLPDPWGHDKENR